MCLNEEPGDGAIMLGYLDGLHINTRVLIRKSGRQENQKSDDGSTGGQMWGHKPRKQTAPWSCKGKETDSPRTSKRNTIQSGHFGLLTSLTVSYKCGLTYVTKFVVISYSRNRKRIHLLIWEVMGGEKSLLLSMSHIYVAVRHFHVDLGNHNHFLMLRAWTLTYWADGLSPPVFPKAPRCLKVVCS